MPDHPPARFGGCCQALRHAMAAPQSHFRVEYDVLFLVVGHTPDQPPQFFDQAVFHCPFCGKRLQTRQAVRSRLARD